MFFQEIKRNKIMNNVLIVLIIFACKAPKRCSFSRCQLSLRSSDILVGVGVQLVRSRRRRQVLHVQLLQAWVMTVFNSRRFGLCGWRCPDCHRHWEMV